MLLAFWILDVTAFYMIKNIVIQFITGALVPLSLFPNAFVSVFKYTPFYYTLYYPVSIYLTNDLSEVKLGLAVLVISIITVFILIRLIYRRAYNYYEGVGM
jgi:ABC-2 type transport system permease protein